MPFSHIRNPAVLVVEGLGNQLFQFTRAHQIQEETECAVLLLTPVRPWRPVDRPFALDTLIAKCDHVNLGLDRRFRLVRGIERVNFKILNKSGYCLPGFRLRITEKESQYISKRLIKKVTHTGFYLDFEFSNSVITRVAEELYGTMIPSNFSLEIQEDYGVIHIRRGDFDNVRFGRLNVEYYKKALAFFPNSLKFFIVTDSPGEVMEISRELDVDTVLGPDELSSWETLELMSKAKCFIGSNSTLSWWGCTLSTMQGGAAIMPKFWFRNEEMPMKFQKGRDIRLIDVSWEN
jgi:hypothetical protein